MPNLSRPAFTDMLPVLVLAPLSVKVPVPFLVTVPVPVPMIEEIEVSYEPSTVRPKVEPVIVPALVRLMLPDCALIVVAAPKVTKPA